MSTTAKTTAARLTPGMTVQLVDLTLISADPFLSTMSWPEGITHHVSCGSVKKSSPVRVVASMEPLPQQYRNLNAVVVTFTTGEVAQMSTRQGVRVVEG